MQNKVSEQLGISAWYVEEKFIKFIYIRGVFIKQLPCVKTS
jgi:hypothetical protein